MKIIKFRQYNYIHKYWHYWGNFNKGQFIFPNNNEGFSESFISSGHSDVNGLEIFEGDIVRSPILNDDLIGEYVGYQYGRVIWSKGECGLAIHWLAECIDDELTIDFRSFSIQFTNLCWHSLTVTGNDILMDFDLLIRGKQT